jgi:hypothetical protein
MRSILCSKRRIPRFALGLGLIAMGVCTPALRAESAHYGISFEGLLEGELPLELELLHLIHKHGIRVDARVTGSLGLKSSRTIFDPVGTGLVEFELKFGELQQLSARLERVGLNVSRRATDAVSVRFGTETISVRQPGNFPALIGDPSVDPGERAFVLAGIELSFRPAALAGLQSAGDGLSLGLSGKLWLRETGGPYAGRETALDLTLTRIEPRRRNLWESAEWRELALRVDTLGLELEDLALPLASSVGVLPPGGGDDDDGLIIIPEPASLSLLAGGLAAVLVLRRRQPRRP